MISIFPAVPHGTVSAVEGALFAAVAARLFLACLFAASVATKVRSGAALEEAIGTVTDARINARLAARAVVMAEGLLAILFVIGVYPSVTASAAAALLVVFTAALRVMRNRTPAAQCGCFGEAMALPVEFGIVRNIILIAVCLVVIVAQARAGSLSPPLWQLPLPLLLSLLTATMSLALMYLLTVYCIYTSWPRWHVPDRAGPDRPDDRHRLVSDR